MTKKKMKEFIKEQWNLIERYDNLTDMYDEQQTSYQEIIAMREEIRKNDSERIDSLLNLVKNCAELLIDQTICEESKCEVGKMILEIYQANKNSQSQEEID